MQTPDDLSLVKQVLASRDQRAFGQLVCRYQQPVRKFLLSLTLGNETLSDDLAQDTFVKAWLHIEQYRGAASIKTWLMRIAYNVFYDYKRKNRALSQPLSLNEGATEADVPEPSAPAAATGEGLSMDICHALSLLKDEERTCITLQLIEGEPIDRIAEITGMGQNTVKSHLHRGKERLANYLKQNGYDR